MSTDHSGGQRFVSCCSTARTPLQMVSQRRLNILPISAKLSPRLFSTHQQTRRPSATSVSLIPPLPSIRDDGVQNTMETSSISSSTSWSLSLGTYAGFFLRIPRRTLGLSGCIVLVPLGHRIRMPNILIPLTAGAGILLTPRGRGRFALGGACLVQHLLQPSDMVQEA